MTEHKVDVHPHDHEHTVHEHEHNHDGVTHAHPHAHEAGLEEEHAYAHGSDVHA